MSKTMLFRPGTKEVIWGIPLDTVTVDDHEVDEHVADGWHLHPHHARDAAAKQADPAQPMSDPEPETLTLQQRAAAVGLKIDGRWSGAKLAEKVEEAEAAAKSEG